MMFLVCRFYHIQFKGIIERILSMSASSFEAVCQWHINWFKVKTQNSHI